MKKFYIACMLALASVGMMEAQTPITWSWTLGNGSSGADDIAESKVDKQGNVVLGGRFSGNVTYNTNPATTIISGGSSDAYVAKTDGNGNFLWVKWISGPAQDYVDAVEVDKNENVIVLADFYDNVDYNPGGAGTHTFQSNQGLSNILLIKYDKNGVVQWAKNIGGSSIDKGYDVIADTLGNIFVTGYFYNTSNFNAGVTTSDTLHSRGTADIFFAKYDPNGVFQWVKQIGSSDFEAPSRLLLDKKNNHVFLSGTYTGWLDVNPSPTDSVFLDTTSWGSNVFISKFDNNGNYQWVNAMTSVGFKSIGEMATDDQSHLYVTGRFNGTTNFNTKFGYDTLYALPGNSSIYFGMYNANGSLGWMKKIEHGYQGGQDAGTAIAVDVKKDIYITGQFWGQGCDFNTSLADTFLLGSNSSNNYDIFLAKYSNTGNFKWAYNFGDAGSDVGVGINFDNSGSLYFTANIQTGSGGTNAPIDFDPDPITFNQYIPTGSDGTLTKYSQCLLDDAATQTAAGLTALQNSVQYQWVNCGVGFAPISGATSQTYLPTATGNYACILTSTATCKDTTACILYDACASFNNVVSVNNSGLMSSSVANATSYQWLTCEANGVFTPIAGATSQTFIPTQNGSYACKAVKGGCVDTSACKEVSNVGFNEYSEDANIRFYPNPAKTVLHIDAASVVSVQVIDLIGHEIRSSQTQRSSITSIQVEQLPAGVYFVRCKLENGKTITRKFIKE